MMSQKKCKKLKKKKQWVLNKGKNQEKIEIAINMLKNNEPIEKVLSYTGLTISEVEELKKNLY